MSQIAAIYEAECKSQGIKTNSKVLVDLKKTDLPLIEWNLQNTMIGTKGARAVLALVRDHLPQLQKLNLSGNNLTSAFTKDLLDAVVSHPNLCEIDLSDNDIRLGGPELVELIKRNRQIVELNADRTHLRNLFARLIEIQLRKNAERMGVKRAPKSIANTEEPAGRETPDPFTFSDAGHRFSFGDAPDPSLQAGEDEALDNFRKVIQESSVGADGKKKAAAPRRPTVSSEVFKEEEIENFEVITHEKTEDVSLWLFSVLERHELFSHLEDFELSVAVGAMEEITRRVDETLFEEGDEDNDIFYVIASGSVKLTSPRETTILEHGATIHDLCLLYPSKSLETATCLSPVSLYTLDRQTYRVILSRASKKKRAMYESFLTTVGFLKQAHLSKSELLQLADSLKPANYNPGEALISYGEIGEAFFIIVEGTVEVFGRDDDGNVCKVCEFTVGECVGELEFLKSHRCVADVKARGHVRTAKMNRLHFEMVMGPVKEVLARTAGESEVYSYYRHQLEKMERGQTPTPAE